MKFTALALVAALFLAAALTGCGSEEISLLSAIMKAPQMTSYEYEGSAQIELNFDIQEREDDEYFLDQPISFYKMIEAAVDGAGVDISAKYSGNKENTKGATEIKMTPVVLGGRLENLSMGVWAQVDMEDPVYLKEYMKLPRILTAGAAWEAMKGRDYLTITPDDFEQVKNITGMDLGSFIKPEQLEAQVESAEKFTDAFTEIIIGIAGLLDTNSIYVQSIDEDAAGNKIYHVKITDKGLKEIFSAFLKIDKTEMKEIIRLLLTTTMDYMQDLYADMPILAGEAIDWAEIAQSALSEFDDSYDTFYPVIIEMLKDFESKGQLIKLLGNDGISLEITITRDGYITDANGIIDLIIDSRGYALAAGNRFTDAISKTHFKLTFQNKFTNVNKDVTVEMPKVTNVNSISISRFIEAIGGDSVMSIAPVPSGIPAYGFGSGGGGAGGGTVIEGDSADGLIQEAPDMLGDLPDENIVVEVVPGSGE